MFTKTWIWMSTGIFATESSFSEKGFILVVDPQLSKSV